jgi:hypothetical protein
MSCSSCTSNNRTRFDAEIMIHFPGRKNLDRPALMVFPQLAVCLDCGFTEFTIPEEKLRLLGERSESTAA